MTIQELHEAESAAHLETLKLFEVYKNSGFAEAAEAATAFKRAYDRYAEARDAVLRAVYDPTKYAPI